MAAERLPGGPKSPCDMNPATNAERRSEQGGEDQIKSPSYYMDPALAYSTRNLIQLGLPHLIHYKVFKKGHSSVVSQQLNPPQRHGL